MASPGPLFAVRVNDSSVVRLRGSGPRPDSGSHSADEARRVSAQRGRQRRDAEAAQPTSTEGTDVPTITTQDGTRIFYKDWGSGPPVVFSHGWPLNADAWDPQAVLVASAGFRAIAHDRRSHGRSTQTWDGNHMDQYADDLAELIEQLDLRDITLVGHSTGGGEVTRYLGRHGTDRVSKAILLSAVPPLMLKTDANPEGAPIEVFDAIREGVTVDRAQYYADLSAPFYGANREGSTVSPGLRDAFWRWCMQAGHKGSLDCIRQFSETDFTEDLKRIDVPVLVAHGDDDQIVPIQAAARKSPALLQDATLRVYEGAPHGLCGRYEQLFNQDLLDFLKGKSLLRDTERLSTV
jgi:non-heme chloroperoxidase